MEQGYRAALALLPERVRNAAERLGAAARERGEEFRLRAGQPPTLLTDGGERRLSETAVTTEEIRLVLDRATRSSFHAVSDELRQGFLSAAGGVRVGVCGRAVTEGGIVTLREISSLALRIPRQMRGAADGLAERIGESSVLILSPPGGGKTTLLRELVRTVSDGGERVGLADERGELAAMQGGLPGFDVGRCTDVLSGAPKAEAAMLLLRGMNPRIIAMDEISAPADSAAILRVSGCGVRIFATAHAASTEALSFRPVYRALLRERIFEKALVISCGSGLRSVEVRTL